MKIDQYTLFIHYLFNINHIPAFLYQGDDLLLQIPTSPCMIEHSRSYLRQLQDIGQTVAYLTTPYDAYYGCVHITDEDLWLFLGPYFLISVTQEQLPNLFRTMQIPEAEQEHMSMFLNGLAFGPLHRFLSYLSCLNFTFNRQIVTIEDIDQSSIPEDAEKAIRTVYTNANYESRENTALHNTYLQEMQRLELITNGDTVGMKKILATPISGRQGRIGHDALRQAKNIFIADCTMCTHAAIAGGLDIEEAYNLSDIFIQTSESYGSVADVERLQKNMPLEFAERVEQEIRLKNVSPLIMSAIHYIKEHVNEPLQADIIASYVNLSTSHFLKRFKSETGMGLSTYIMQTKIHEACTLLSYTDKSLTEISNYLYFSSQSYFQNVFKKITGMTPRHYRNQMKKPSFLKTR